MKIFSVSSASIEVALFRLSVLGPLVSREHLLQGHGLSRPLGAASEPEEHRSYEAHYAGYIWYGDVMHGPRVPVTGRILKTAMQMAVPKGLKHLPD